MDSNWSLHLPKKSSGDGSLFQLIGNRMVKFFPGRKLDYEPKHCQNRGSEQDFMTAVEFSAEDPYGKAVALLDLKSGFVKVNEEWMVVPGITSAFILADVLKKEGYDGFSVNCKNLEMDSVTEAINESNEESKRTNLTTSMANDIVNVDVAEGNIAIPEKGSLSSGGCGSGCGGGCGNVLKSGGCGGCGSGCGSMLKSGGCGGCGSGGCGSGCGNMMKSGGCGSGGCGGCGSGCGNMLKSGGSGFDGKFANDNKLSW